MRVAKYFFKHKQTNYYLLNPLYSRYNKKKRGSLKFCFEFFAGISGNLYSPERTDQKGRLNTMFNLNNDTKKLAIGLMSGTSADGIDAALVEISGCSTTTKVRQLAFVTLPFTDAVRNRILRVARGISEAARSCAF